MNKYDAVVLGLITACTAAVVLLLFIIKVIFGVEVYPWWMLPVGWWIGAIMTWGYGKIYS